MKCNTCAKEGYCDAYCYDDGYVPSIRKLLKQKIKKVYHQYFQIMKGCDIYEK